MITNRGNFRYACVSETLFMRLTPGVFNTSRQNSYPLNLVSSFVAGRDILSFSWISENFWYLLYKSLLTLFINVHQRFSVCQFHHVRLRKTLISIPDPDRFQCSWLGSDYVLMRLRSNIDGNLLELQCLIAPTAWNFIQLSKSRDVTMAFESCSMAIVLFYWWLRLS